MEKGGERPIDQTDRSGHAPVFLRVEREREQVFIGKQKDDLDGVAVPTPYLQQYFYTIATTQM